MKLRFRSDTFFNVLFTTLFSIYFAYNRSVFAFSPLLKRQVYVTGDNARSIGTVFLSSMIIKVTLISEVFTCGFFQTNYA